MVELGLNKCILEGYKNVTLHSIYALKAFLLLKIIFKSIFSKPFKDFKSASNSKFMTQKIKKDCFAYIYSSLFTYNFKA
jgi:hypothetical protein